MKVLIVGAGIGGLTAAICCLHRGHDVQIFEQAPELGEVGAGIQIPPNAMKVFKALGIADALIARGFTPQSIEMRMGQSGRNIFSIPLADYTERVWGAPYLHIHRADYIEVLQQALAVRAPSALNLGQSVTGHAQDEKSVTLRFEDGRTATGECLIGADGIHSVIRAQIVGPDLPTYTGNMAWRAVVPVAALGDHKPRPTACAWVGAGQHAVTYYVRGGAWINFVGVIETDQRLPRAEQKESWSIQGSRAQALQDFAGWHPVITDILKACDPDVLFRWALFDRPPLQTWTEGRVALLGDAAHPMLPFLAQGAAMAVEDAWVLASQLGGSPVPQALRAYQHTRQARTAKVQARSRANMRIFHQRSGLGQLSTYGPMWLAGKIWPKIVHSRMDWLYGYDVTKSN